MIFPVKEIFLFYSPSPEYSVGYHRDEWRGEPRSSSKSEGGLASAQFRFDTPQLAQRRRSRGASACAACAPRVLRGASLASLVNIIELKE